MRGGRVPQAQPEWTRDRITGATMTVAPIVAVMLIEFLVGVTLVSAIPLWLYGIAAILGAAYANAIIGFLPANNAPISPKRLFQLISVFGLFALGIAPYLFRQAVLFSAFAFTNVPTATELYVIDGGSTGRRRADMIYLRPIVDGRRFRIMTSADLPDRYRHVSTHGRDCIRLKTQTGRGGLKRAQTPSIYDAEFNDNLFTTASVVANCKASDAFD